MITARDVAERAGVSQVTVSHVMSGSRPTSEATKKQVRKAMDELGYVPSINTQSLADGKVGVISALVRMNEDTDLAELRPFLVVIMEETKKQGSSVMLVPVGEGIGGLCRMMRQGVVDGALVFDVEWHDKRLPEVARLDILAVLAGTPEDAHDLLCADVDYHRVAQMAVSHLAERGIQRMVLAGDWGGSLDRCAFVKFFASESRMVAQVLGMECEALIPCEEGQRDIQVVKGELKRMAQYHGGIAVRTLQVSDSLLQSCMKIQIQPGRDFSLVAVYVDGRDEGLRVPVDNVDPMPQSVAKVAVGLLLDRIDGHKTGEKLLVFPYITVYS